MKKLLATFLLTLALAVISQASSRNQRFNINQSLYDDLFPALSDSNKFLFGINYRINDFERFDGNVIQVGTRFKPFFGKMSLRSLVLGFNLTGYFNRNLFWINNAYKGGIFDNARDGYTLSVLIGYTIKIRNSQLYFGFAPRLNLMKALSFQVENGKYYNYRGFDNNDRYGYSGSIIWGFQRFELFGNYHTGSITQDYFDWEVPRELYNGNYYFDSTRTSSFSARTYIPASSIYNFRYGAILHAKLSPNPIDFYFYSDSWRFSGGGIIHLNKWIINPELTVHPSFYSTALIGPQIGCLFKYEIAKDFSLKAAILHSLNVLYTRTLTGEFGFQYKI